MDTEPPSPAEATKRTSCSDSLQDIGLKDLLQRVYESKDGIVEAVQGYHAKCMRNFKVAFAFKFSLKSPSKLIPHSCQPDLTIQGRRRFCTATYLVKQVDLREYFLSSRRKTSPILFKKTAEELGMCRAYMNCVNACKTLMEEVFGSDRAQYNRIPAYIEELNKIGHKTTCDGANGVFHRLVILFREGMKSFSQYTKRGLTIDRTFLKTTVGETLLVACFKIGNSELQVVGIAVVSIENQINWEYFLRFLMSNVEVPPAFLISDRDKGLIPAVAVLDSAPHHFFCFRHLMENFNRKFKSRVLKDAAWALARSTTEFQFEQRAKLLTLSATTWLTDIGKEKWSLCYSPCPRYGMLTSNNVELVNGVLRGVRKLPILDCLMAIERYVGAKWVTSGIAATNRGLLTHRASSKVVRSLSVTDNIQATQYSESSFIVSVKEKRGEAPVQYSVQLCGCQAVCNCGFEKDMKAPASIQWCVCATLEK